MSEESKLPPMHRAIELSLEKMADDDGGPFGAVIVKDGEIIAEGWNSVVGSCDPTAHAEIEAIRKACMRLDQFHLEGCSIYTSCEPCPMCLSAIYWAKIEKIYYANSREDAAVIDFDDNFIYKEIARDKGQRSIPMEQQDREIAQKVFRAWEQKEDKVQY